MRSNFFISFLAGCCGCVCMLIWNPVGYFTKKSNCIHSTSSPISVQPVFATAQRNYPMNDFTTAAQMGIASVVNIAAGESDDLARQRIKRQQWSNPFSWLEDDLYNRMEGAGSGVIFTSDGYIVTNNHVVDFADKFEVTLSDNRKFPARLIGYDPKSDLAVLKIDAKNLPVMRYADSDQARIGEWVLAIGNPFNLKSTVTAGIISAVGRDINIIKAKDAIEAFIQTDAAVNPGNSGGALIDDQGRLLGINTAIASNTGSYSGYSFAIPINMVKRIAGEIIQKGSSQRPQLGIQVYDLDDALIEELQLNVQQGVLIVTVERGSIAHLAGFKKNDVITAINGVKVLSAEHMMQIINKAQAGDKLTISINRYGKIGDLPVVLHY